MIETIQAAGGGAGTGSITNPALGDNLQNLEGASFFDRLLSTGITLFFIVGGIVFLIMLISGGVQWITAAGNKDQLEGAQKRITNALIGIVVLFSVYAIVRLVGSIFGINILTIDIDPLIIR